MWGSKEGWLISAIIAGLMGWLIWTMGQVGKPSPPSGDFPQLTARIEVPIKPESVVPIFTESRDAGDEYWQAVSEYLAKKDIYDNFFAPKEPKFSRLDKLSTVEPAMKLLLQATAATEAKIFIRKPQLLVNYEYPYPELKALYTLGRIAGQIGLAYSSRGEWDEAERYYNAEFSLGKNLFDERINASELFEGVSLMREAVLYLSGVARKRNDQARKAQLETFDQQLKGWHESKVNKLTKAVISLETSDIKRHAGDVFLLATSSPERMWRVEALLKVGRLKFNAGPQNERQSYVNQVWATRYLTQPARVGMPDPTQDPDPAVRLAAQLARDLTVEGFHQIDLTE
jgi:hypothetical protein